MRGEVVELADHAFVGILEKPLACVEIRCGLFGFTLGWVPALGLAFLDHAAPIVLGPTHGGICA